MADVESSPEILRQRLLPKEPAGPGHQPYIPLDDPTESEASVSLPLPSYQSLRLKCFLILEGGWSPWDRIVQWALLFVIMANVVLFMLSTVTSIREVAAVPMDYLEAVCIYIFMLEFGLRIWVNIEKPRFKKRGPFIGRLLFLVTFASLVDILSIIPFWVDWGIRLSNGDSFLRGRQFTQFTSALRLFRVFRILKAEKYTKAFRVLLKVLKSKRDVLLVAAMMWVFLLLCTATALYYVQETVDPSEFGSIPASFYGAILLLTGQGFWFDVPATPSGRWVVAISNIFSVAVFAIPAGILASGFEPIGEEMIQKRQKKRRERAAMMRRLNMVAELERQRVKHPEDFNDPAALSDAKKEVEGVEKSHVFAKKRRTVEHELSWKPPHRPRHQHDDSDTEDYSEDYSEIDVDEEDMDDDEDEDNEHRTVITVRRFGKRLGRVVTVEGGEIMDLLNQLSSLMQIKIVALLDKHNGIVYEMHQLRSGQLYVAVTEPELRSLE